MKKLTLILAFIFSVGISFAHAQTALEVRPYGVTTGNYSNTIAVTNAFQSVLTASTTTSGRQGCTIQNNSISNPMYVYFGAIATATISKSVKLSAGQSTYCNTGIIILKDQVSITGTAGDSFYASQQ